MNATERRQRIEQIMRESNSDETSAGEMLAMELGESDGDCITVDDDGRPIAQTPPVDNL